MTYEVLSSCFDNLQRRMPEERVCELFRKYDANSDGGESEPE